MKLVFICSEYPPFPAGGIGTFTRGLCEALAARGHVVHVVGHYSVVAPQRECINGVWISRLPARRGRKALIAGRVDFYREIRGIAASGAIDIVEAPDFEGATALLPRQSRVRIARLHGSHRYFSDERGVGHSPSIAFMEKIALAQADAIISVSDYTARRTKELFRLSQKVTTVHNAVTVPVTFQRKLDYGETKRAVYFGTLAEKKGVLALAEAWREFSRTHPGWTLTMIGRDSAHAGASVQATMLSLLGDAANSVEFVGYMPNDEVLGRLPEFDFAVLPSFSEAFALAPMEAMALGLPVIYSSMLSGPELIEDGANGWLCDPRSCRSIEGALARAAGNAQDRESVGRNAISTVEGRFSYRAFIDQNVSLYESLLASRGHSA